MTGRLTSLAQRLDALTPGQREAVEAAPGPVAIIAGAGSGKTTTVAARIAARVARGDAEASKILAVTHSRKAAGELRERLVRLDPALAQELRKVDASTFHAAALRQLSIVWHATGRAGKGPVVQDNKYQAIRAAARAVLGTSRDIESDLVVDLTSEISWAQVQRLSIETFETAALHANRATPLPPNRIAQVWDRYSNDKHRAGVLDFEDLLTVLAAEMELNPKIATMIRRRWQHFVVDEYQDTDPLQQHLLDQWLGDNDDLTVVGDPRQAIFGFKGAEAGFLLDFDKQHPRAKVISLVENFRSTDQVVKVANVVAGRIRSGFGDSAHLAADLVARNGDGPNPRVASFETEAIESTMVARVVRDWIATGTPANEIAILYRFNSQSARFEGALNDAGVRTSVNDGTPFFSRPEVLNILRPFGSQARTHPDADGLALLVEAAHQSGWNPEQPPGGVGAARERWEAVGALVSLGTGVAQTGQATAKALLTELLHRAKEAHDPSINGVTLATLHKSKGLEWDNVIIVGATEGSIPSAFATTDAQMAEELNLLYVGVTRARKNLLVTWAERKPSPKGDGRTWSNKPSRWLGMLGSERVRTKPTIAAPAAGTNRSCAGCKGRLVGIHQMKLRRCPSCLAGIDKRMHDAALAWREETAAGKGIGASTVATDAALIGIVATRPASATELHAIAGIGEVDNKAVTKILALVAATI